jgi:hypothetical protein
MDGAEEHADAIVGAVGGGQSSREEWTGQLLVGSGRFC